MDYSVTIDGNLGVKDTEGRCEAEQLGGFKLDSIVHGTVLDGGNVELVNNAAFDLATPDAIFSDLEFHPLGADAPDAVRVQMKAQGWSFICDSQIYVSGQLTRVLVFGRN